MKQAHIALMALLIVVITLAGCNAVKYGWDSPEFENQLVDTNTERGKRRLAQIVEYDETVAELVRGGFQPDYLYEITSDDFYLISSADQRFVHCVRTDWGTKSTAITLNSLPTYISDMVPVGLNTNEPVVTQISPVPPQTETADTESSPVELKSPAYTYYPGTSGIHIIGYEYQPKILGIQRAEYASVIDIEVLSDTYEREVDSKEATSLRVQTGTRKEYNEAYIRAETAVQTAQYEYVKAINSEPTKGYDAASSLVSGMLHQKRINDARDDLNEAKLRLRRTPEYLLVPEYGYKPAELLRYNLKRTIKVRLYKYEDGGPVLIGDTTGVLTASKSYSNPSEVESAARQLMRKKVNLSPLRVTFKAQ